jgi:hypothetical protein
MRRIITYCTVQWFAKHEPGDHMGIKPNDSLIHPIADHFAIQRGVAIRTVSQPESNSTISVSHPTELSSETQQTPGSLRCPPLQQCMALSPRCGQAYLWSSLQGRPAFTTMANRTPLFTSLKERLLCGGANSANTRSLLGRAIFCMCRVGATSET